MRASIVLLSGNTIEASLIMLKKHELTLGKLKGASPAEDRFYVTVLFDISDAKKYRRVIKVLKSYSSRIQYSIFEAYLKREQIKGLRTSLEQIMASESFFNPTDRIRIYQISGNCELTVLGEYLDNIPEQNVII